MLIKVSLTFDFVGEWRLDSPKKVQKDTIFIVLSGPLNSKPTNENYLKFNYLLQILLGALRVKVLIMYYKEITVQLKFSA